MKQYVYTKAITRSGFGVEGVFDKAVIDAAPRICDGWTPVVEADAVIVGMGPGLDDKCVLDDQWLTRACELMNKAAAGTPAADYAYKTIAEYEELVGFKVGEAFRIGWKIARDEELVRFKVGEAFRIGWKMDRTTNAMFDAANRTKDKCDETQTS